MPQYTNRAKGLVAGVTLAAAGLAGAGVGHTIESHQHEAATVGEYSKPGLARELGKVVLTESSVIVHAGELGDTPTQAASRIAAPDQQWNVTHEIAEQLGGAGNLQPESIVVLPDSQLAMTEMSPYRVAGPNNDGNTVQAQFDAEQHAVPLYGLQPDK